jgi:hypothetical protein
LPVTGAWRAGDEPGRRQFVTFDREFALEAGGTLPSVTVAYETWGTLAPDASNAVLVLHALTGDSHATGPAEPGHLQAGWWDGMIGPGAPIDTDRFFVVCPNVLGGCQGTTGPASDALSGDGPYGSRFPRITIRDQVAVEASLVDELGIEQTDLAYTHAIGHAVYDFRRHLVIRVDESICELVVEVRLNGRVALRHPVLAHGEIVVNVNDSLLTTGRPDRVFLFKVGIDVSIQAGVSVFALDDDVVFFEREFRLGEDRAGRPIYLIENGTPIAELVADLQRTSTRVSQRPLVSGERFLAPALGFGRLVDIAFDPPFARRDDAADLRRSDPPDDQEQE